MLERFQSALGVLVMMAVAYALCPRDRRRRVRLRTVAWGLALLLGLGVLVLRTPLNAVFAVANSGVSAVLRYSNDGARFLFGSLVDDSSATGFLFAFQVLPTILVFAALMAILYHLGVMPYVIKKLARGLSRTLGTSSAESLSTVADIFVGQTEAPLVIRPYLPTLTRSELNACMVAGFATTAGAVLAGYVQMLSKHVPDIAGHLIACSVMSAPASLVVAKLMLPETEQPLTSSETPIDLPRSTENLLDAIASGTKDGLLLAVNVAAMLIVFLALTALVNAGLGWAGMHLLGTSLSLERILGWVFTPLAWVMGVPAADVQRVATLLGQKTVLNEFVAYAHMTRMLDQDPGWLSERGRLIASYALCGFANFGSIGIQIGGYAGLAPTRRADLSRLALKAMLGGLLATCMVACVAGILL